MDKQNQDRRQKLPGLLEPAGFFHPPGTIFPAALQHHIMATLFCPGKG
jgi:hypothetical protein